MYVLYLHACRVKAEMMYGTVNTVFSVAMEYSHCTDTIRILYSDRRVMHALLYPSPAGDPTQGGQRTVKH